MDMATSTMAMAASSTMAMSTASSTSMSTTVAAVDWMDMNTMGMAMTFFTTSVTPLYSMGWMPTTLGQYAGTCIFLIVFAALFRGLLAVRVQFYQILNGLDARNNGGVAWEDEKEGREGKGYGPWRAREAMLGGLMDVVLAGVGYLLMIAVMTMNVGYFLSVLAGVFVGSVVFSRFMGSSPAH